MAADLGQIGEFDDGEYADGYIDWDWGEIYVWGGVTFTPARSSSSQDQAPKAEAAPSQARPAARRLENVQELSVLARKVWTAVVDQYPAAAKQRRFAGTTISPMTAATRFNRLAEVLNITGMEALELICVDATPLLVDPDDVISAYELLARISSPEKALELVRRHPGLLVGGSKKIKDGASVVTAALIDILFAGRLRVVLEDHRIDDNWKLAEIELYTTVAKFFKPVMDLVQRRSLSSVSQ